MSLSVKIEAAKKSLEYTRKTINETVVYSDMKAFRNVFIRITGYRLITINQNNKGN